MPLTSAKIARITDRRLDKGQWHRMCGRLLKELAEDLCLHPDTYEVRSNKGGDAVRGEVTLHSDRLYVQIGEQAFENDLGVLYRRCRGRRDFAGLCNNWIKAARWAASPDAFRNTLISLAETEVTR